MHKRGIIRNTHPQFAIAGYPAGKKESAMPKDQIVDNSDMSFINKANILIEALP